jgi:ferredoxin-NADP reductase
MDATFVKKQLIGPNIWEFFVKPEGELSYLPGQYVHVTLRNAYGDYRGSQRAFTLTSLPTDSLLSFAVKFPEPHSVYKQVLQSLRPGDDLTIGHSLGDMVLPRAAERPLVFVAGGLGVASYISIMKWLTATGQKRRIRLLYAHKPKEQLFQDVIVNCPGLTVEHVVSPNRLSVSDIAAEREDDTLFYLSGSEAFTLGLRDALLQEQHVASGSIVYDYFDGYHTSDV